MDELTGQNTENNNPDLIWFFKNFETVLSSNKKPSIENLSAGTDFKVFSKYLIDDVRKIQKQLINANDEYLLYACEHTFNIMDWIKLIVGNRSQIFSDAIECVFDEHFADKYILQNIYNTSLEKWIYKKSGQHKIGENFYNVLSGNLYYRNRFDQWFRVEKGSAFDIQPNKKLIKNNDVIDQLNKEYQETWYDVILNNWRDKHYKGVLPDDFMRFEDKETSPEAYFDFTVDHIKSLLNKPVSIKELERWNGNKIVDLEDTVKLCSLALNIVRKRREDNNHTIYLLRDCLVFYEIHKTLDILNSEETSIDQLLIGRKLLSHKPDKWEYYIVTLEALYDAHKRYPTDFTKFYNEYARLLDIFASMNPGFVVLLGNLAEYIKKHMQTKKNKIVIFDVGFQGSINLLIKYVIERRIKPLYSSGDIETEIKIAIGAEWSKELFGDRYESDYFPFLNRIQLLARSDELYHYKLGSLDDGSLRVVMGNKQWQQKASIELVILVMITLSEYTGS